jgi:hypothetical protein
MEMEEINYFVFCFCILAEDGKVLRAVRVAVHVHSHGCRENEYSDGMKLPRKDLPSANDVRGGGGGVGGGGGFS